MTRFSFWLVFLSSTGRSSRCFRGGGAGGQRCRRSARASVRRIDSACVDCGATGGLTIDHVKPLSKGGANHPNNMETRCLECNLRKGAR